VIDGPEKVRAQQLGKLPRIDAMTFVANFQEHILAWTAGQHLVDECSFPLAMMRTIETF
jgi:hypothetical protein